jgi:hypothetical protein
MVGRIAILVALLSAGCLESPTAPTAVLGTPFELAVGRAASLPDGARIRFDRVDGDSRCPMNARCVWEGDATVAISIMRNGEPADPRELHTAAGGSQISYSTYTIKITALAPDRRTDREIRAEDYIATLVVQTR